MKLRFDANQPYQLDAIRSTLDIFDGQPPAESQRMLRLDAPAGDLFSELWVQNRLVLDDEQLEKNVRWVQEANRIKGNGWAGRHFSVEMETGTGKTYVYLRTIHELHARFGFTKFIIVVPSVAIREGVMKSIELTREHFQELYGKKPVDSWIYDSRQVSRLRQFAAANTPQVLVINIDAFNKKDIAVIHKEHDRMSGRKPIEFVQAVNPVVIVDEPQNMESQTAKDAIASLNPLCTLRYSATHRDPYNLIYQLDPVRAYDLGLVKRIEVASVMEEGGFNQPYIQMLSTRAVRSRLTAQVELDVRSADGVKRERKTLKHGDDLLEITGRELYRGFKVSEINHGEQYVEFANGHRIQVGNSIGGNTDALMRAQVRETVKTHFDKELKLRKGLPPGERMKVLSLFFIDRVAHYYDENGKIRRWFIEAYRELAAQPQYTELGLLPVEQVHNGYFARDRQGQAKDTRGDTQADDEAYELIMRDKERLLSPEEPLCFIFSHSALREGWDNPNIFQICTLNETRSEIKKRQEIGRGLRLPVMASGLRCFDPHINRLTVIANEAYEDFARKLQNEIEEDCGVQFGDRIKNRRDRQTLRLRKGWQLNEDFRELWERIKHKTRYRVQYDTEVLIAAAAKAIREMPPVSKPAVVTRRALLTILSTGVDHDLQTVRQNGGETDDPPIPDLLSYLQHETELTRHTLAKILIRSGRLGDVRTNPQQFLDLALKAIQRALNQIVIDGIRYERIDGQCYEMRLFEDEQLEAYLSNLVKVGRSIYEHVEFNSEVERKFAETLDKREDIRLFVKLPRRFTVETPVGPYNPDWAIVMQCDDKVYLVRETKGSTATEDLRETEWAKIRCGKAHFDELNVDFAAITSTDELRCS